MNLLPQSDESIRDEILEHLNKKYDMEFTALALDRGHSELLLCHVKEGDPEADLVHAKRLVRDDGIEITDTYFGIVIREEIEADILSILSGVDLKMRVFYPSNDYFYDNMFDNTKNYADFKQWIDDGNPWRFDVSIILFMDDVTEGEAYADHVFEIIDEAGFRGYIYLTVLPEEGYENITRTNLNDLISQYDGETALFTKSVN